MSLTSVYGQSNTIKLANPSFEGTDAAGLNGYFNLPGWNDCAPNYFPGETAPDIHSAYSNHFDVKHIPYDGNTFLGMVTREYRETYEMVSQKLDLPLKANRCYKFSILLAKSDVYLSNIDATGFENSKKNFNNPVKLRIWGSTSNCSKSQLLAESSLVNHNDWRQYNFKLKPNRDYQYILFEAFYKTPVLIPYNGNILLDNASDIIEIPCPDSRELAMVEVKKPQNEIHKKTEIVNKPIGSNNRKSTTKANNKKVNDSVSATPKKEIKADKRERILKGLEKDKILIGQTIRIENLFFEADSSNIKPGSYEVLDEIHAFLDENPNVIIEIGGHTNGVPNEDYCNILSTERAKNVAEYLYKKGIQTFRIKYRGYGKLKPLALDNTPDGRKKNQRVEIKILYIGSKSFQSQ